MQEADMSMTNMALSGGNNSRHIGDEFLFVKFFMDSKQHQAKSAEAGHPVFDDVPFIQIMQPGNKDNIIIRAATAMDKTRFAEHFRKFEARITDDVMEGMPLEQWPMITRGQCENLRFHNVRTVEQLANMSDANSQGMMGIGVLRQKAVAYLEDADINAAKQALAEQKALNASLLERLEALEAEEPTPKKRGRPKKAVPEME